MWLRDQKVGGKIINITRSQLLSETKRILKNYDLRAFKSYSQNFVIDPKLIQWHLQYSNITNEDVVVEIGAGLGTLTKYLAEKAKKVTAVEVDPKLVEVLHEELASFDNIEIISEDILKLDSKIFEGMKVVSNTPYKISSPLTFKIIQSSYALSILSYQKEFATRMTATPGSKNYGRITLGVSYYANVEYLKSIPRDYFYPMPKVESTLIRLTPHEPPIQLEDVNGFFEFVRHLFSFRNKSIKRALGLYLKQTDPTVLQKTKLANHSLAHERVFRLSLQQFHELYQFIRALKDD
ncbi:MAG: ribosomal RNA small subunit methyltransferase A [Candidatus Helarchaeota archaeon]|nr:ribosomal RNA small subunit methyltransferase A [Candidatus Helarchaeota archaeon]